MPSVIGLAAAILVGWLRCPAPRQATLSGRALLLDSIWYVAMTAMASSAAAAVAASWRKNRSGSIPMRVAGAGVWFAPLMVLAAGGSGWAAVPLVVVAAGAAALFPGRTEEEPLPPASPAVLAPPEVRLLRQLPSSLAAAFCLQAAVVAGLGENALAAGGMLAIGVGLLSWQIARLRKPRESNLIDSWVRAALSLTLAILFTIFGMLPYLRTGGGTEIAGKGTGSGAGDADQDKWARAAAARIEVDESYRGVILWPPVQRTVTLVPPLPALGHNPFERNQNPLSIPFFGAYWFFRPPFTRPPEGSVEMRGNPTDLTFRSQSARPLLMEARQNLGKLFDVSCCQRIELAIRNRDRYSEIVSIELILMNTMLAGRPLQSLGMVPVTSRPGFISAKQTVPAAETLRFPIPRERALRQFDELVVRFERPAVRAQQSANIAIERFVLVPFGR